VSIRLPIMPVVGAQDTALCTRCGGECCKGTPGASDPSDFLDANGELDEYALLEVLESDEWVVVHWDGDPRERYNEETDEYEYPPVGERVGAVYFPRPQYKNKIDTLHDDRWPWDGDGCNFLTESGCRLSFEKRPYGCRSLIPKWSETFEKFACSHEGGQENKRAALNWLPFQDKLFEVVKCVNKEW